jgi:hypothetical protein
MKDKIKVYRSYEFIDKDPVIERIREMIEKERLLKKPGIVHELSGVSRQTIHNWFYGETRRPQYATVMAVAGSLGYQPNFRQVERIDVEAERKAAAKWRARQEAKIAAAKASLIASRKAARAASGAHGAVAQRS